MIDWTKAPEWAKYHAFDADGRGRWHQYHPHIEPGQWFWSQRGYKWASGYTVPMWNDSLVKNPAQEQPT